MKELIKNIKFAWVYTKKQKTKLIFYVLCNIIAILIGIFIPILSAKIIVELTNNNFEQLIYTSLVILGVELSRNVINYFSKYFSQVVYRESFIELQTSLGNEILKLENRCIDQNGSGVFIQRLTNDTSRMSDIFNVLNMYLSNIIMDLGIFVAIFIVNKIVFIYIVIMVLVLYVIDHNRVKKVNEKDKVFRKLTEQATSFVGELVRGNRDIKMLNAENSFLEELGKKVRATNEQRYDMSLVDRNYTFFRGSFNDLFNTGLIFVIVALITSKQLEVAGALIVYNYVNRVTSIIWYLSVLMEKLKDFNLSSKRIFDIIYSEEFSKEVFGTKHLGKIDGNFEFHNVSFQYEDKLVLNDISFAVKANETVAFVGKSGAGKSTIFHLLCKMYNVTDGEIIIDGVNINQLDKDTIRGNITIINQNPYIFNLSIRENLRLVKENLTEEEMIEACQLAFLHDFIITLKDGYDTVVGEGGVTLSGGQKQRLAIARAFVQKTEIILFDEATSALDNETQASIKQAIDNLKKDYTILIIAHRLSTIVDSDRILFLNDGKIESSGNHEQLLKTNHHYKQLYEAELKVQSK